MLIRIVIVTCYECLFLSNLKLDEFTVGEMKRKKYKNEKYERASTQTDKKKTSIT